LEGDHHGAVIQPFVVVEVCARRAARALYQFLY
jgi:hypothetical protein